MVRCADNALYTGISTDVDERLRQHQEGERGAKFLRGRGPLQLAFSAPLGDRSLASRAEYLVKRLSKASKERLVEGSLKLEQVLTEGP
ncbi:MAG: GIY-YIG nuclease family protein [Vulcanimicrobiota bacterium]